jgi:hypothetical protein
MLITIFKPVQFEVVFPIDDIVGPLTRIVWRYSLFMMFKPTVMTDVASGTIS